MNRFFYHCILFLAVCCGLAASAQDQPAPNADQDIDQRLAAARQRLEAAAREIAELSGNAAGNQAFGFAVATQSGQRKAMLGIVIEGAGNDGKSDGVVITAISPDGPADAAGLKTGDLIVSLNGESLSGSSSGDSRDKLLQKMEAIEPGAKVTVAYIRDGHNAKADLETVAVQPPMFNFALGNGDFNFRVPGPDGRGPGPEHRMFFRLAREWGDLELVEVTPALGKYFGTEEGVLVVRAPKDSKLKMMEGDVSLGIGDRKPKDPNHALGILRSYAPGESLVIEIMRDKHIQKLQVTVPEGDGDNVFYQSFPAPMTAPMPPGATMPPAAPAPGHLKGKLGV